MDEDKLEFLGELIDNCDNHLALIENDFMKDEMKIDSLKSGLETIREKLFNFYTENGGENVWE